MPKFTYTGQTRGGEKITRTVDAKDRFAVYEIAREEGHTIADVQEDARMNLSSFLNIEKIEYAISRISGDELIIATRNLGSMLEAGLPLSRALSVIERQSTNPRMKGVIKDIRERINKGEQFNEAISNHPKVFSKLFIAMVRAGEESGEIAGTLQTLANQMEQTNTLKKKIRGAMIYPAIVITVLFIIGVLMMIYVVPTITETFKDLEAELPTSTKIIIWISDFLSNNTLLALVGIVAFIFGFFAFLRTKAGIYSLSWIVVRIPVIGKIAKEVNAARTARTLSSLLSSGVNLIRALEITNDVVQNVYYKAIIKDAAERVEKGTPLSQPFIERSDLYPVLVGEMIAVGEETGKISGMLEQLATFYENEVSQKTKDLSTIIEPILMVVIGSTVGFFALAMISPIYSISDAI